MNIQNECLSDLYTHHQLQTSQVKPMCCLSSPATGFPYLWRKVMYFYFHIPSSVPILSFKSSVMFASNWGFTEMNYIMDFQPWKGHGRAKKFYCIYLTCSIPACCFLWKSPNSRGGTNICPTSEGPSSLMGDQLTEAFTRATECQSDVSSKILVCKARGLCSYWTKFEKSWALAKENWKIWGFH